MPFIAENEDDLVTPVTVTTEDELICPACETEMTVRGSHERDGTFVARHFVHIDEDAECPGESNTHLQMKSIAAAKLAREYPDAEIDIETSLGDRQPDVLVEFPEERHPLGKGIAVEVQHRNKSKKKGEVTSDYLSNGYSVLWLNKRHFSGKDVRIGHVTPVWPAAIEHATVDSYYPDVLVNPEKNPVKQRVQLPDEAIRVTAAEQQSLRWHWVIGRVNEKRGQFPQLRNDGEWNEIVSTRIGEHGEVKLLGTPDGEPVLQFEKVGAMYEDARLGVKLDFPRDLSTTVSFVLEIDRQFSVAQRAEGVGMWKSITEKSVGVNPSRMPRYLKFSLDPDGSPAIVLSEKDPTEPDIPIRLSGNNDVEALFEFVAAVIAQSDPRHVSNLTNKID